MIKYISVALLSAIYLLLFINNADAAVNWSTLTAETLSQLQPSEFNTINSTQLSSIPVAAISGMSSTQLSYIPADAATGFSVAQVAKLTGTYSTDACSGFTAAVMYSIPATVYSGFLPGCVGIIHSEALSQWTSEQLSNLTSIAARGFTSNIAGLNPSAFAGFSSAQLGILKNSYSTDACGNLLPNQIAFMPPAAFSGWNRNCVFLLKSMAFSSITAAQMSFFPPDGAKGLTADVVQNMSPQSGAGWTSASLSAVASTYSTDGCGGFSADHVANMTPSAFSGWTKNCVFFSA